MNVIEILDRRAAHAAHLGQDLMALELRQSLAAVADLIHAAEQLADWIPTTKGGIDRGQNIANIRAALMGVKR